MQFYVLENKYEEINKNGVVVTFNFQAGQLIYSKQ